MLVGSARVLLLRVSNTRSCSSKMVRWAVGGVSTLTADTDLSVIATFDAGKYLFNAPEQFSRACIQHRRGFRKINAIFLTRIHSDTSAGLPGYLMTLGDAGTTKMTVVGPQGLGLFMTSTRSYAIRSNLQLDMTEVAAASAEPCFKDDNLSVYAVPIAPHPVQSSLKRKREDDALDEPQKASRITDGSRAHRHGQKMTAEPWRNVSAGLGFMRQGQYNERDIPLYCAPLDLALAYVCVGPLIRGKFDAARAQELGVVGRDRGRLTRGQTVTLANGTVVTPDMCIAPSIPPATFFVVDCPSPSYIDGLVAAPQFARHRADGELPVRSIYYRLGDGVLHDPRFKAWMSSFGPDVHHILAAADSTPDSITFTTQAELLLKLSHLDGEIFLVPKYSLDAKEPLSTVTGLPANVRVHDPYTEVVMHPQHGPAPVPRIVEDAFHAQHALGVDVALDNDTSAAFDAARNAAAAFRGLPEQPGDNVRVITLGTSSAVSSMYRNVLGNVVEIPDLGDILLDCGEGTFGQLVRCYGQAGVADALRRLRAVFISHNHGDHHMGLSRVLSKRRQLAPDAGPLYLIAPSITLLYLHEYHRIEDIGLDAGVVMINSEDIRVDDWPATTPAYNRPAQGGDQHYGRTQRSRRGIAELASAMRFASIETTFVSHRCAAYAIVLRHQDGWSLAFSGDTRPCDSLVIAGKDVTLLIHEASMADDQEELADKKGHSTFGQALDIAKRMNAKNLLLTHFSNRYPKLPVIAKDRSGGDGPVVGVAFDFMSVSLGAMKRLNSYLPVLESCFASTIEEEDIAAPGGDSEHVHV